MITNDKDAKHIFFVFVLQIIYLNNTKNQQASWKFTYRYALIIIL